MDLPPLPGTETLRKATRFRAEAGREETPLDDRHARDQSPLPGRVPRLADLSDRDLCDLVRRTLGRDKAQVSDPTILRAAGRKRARCGHRLLSRIAGNTFPLAKNRSCPTFIEWSCGQAKGHLSQIGHIGSNAVSRLFALHGLDDHSRMRAQLLELCRLPLVRKRKWTRYYWRTPSSKPASRECRKNIVIPGDQNGHFACEKARSPHAYSAGDLRSWLEQLPTLELGPKPSPAESR